MMNTATIQPAVHVSNPTAPLEAISAAAGYVRQNWGDYGYSMTVEASTIGRYLFGVRCSDGSEFYIWSDRYGNCEQVEYNGSQWQPIAS